MDKPYVTITHIDTACMLLSINGFRILTDPTLDRAGRTYHHAYGGFSRKTGNPAVSVDQLERIDLVLLSHHQHKDNFDVTGRMLTKGVPLVLSTFAACRELPNAIGLDAWDYFDVTTSKVTNLRITATPAQHRPWWIPEFISGKVIGFVIEFEEQERGVIYISGDTVYFRGIDEVGRRFKIDTGIFHVGSAQFRYLTGCARYTMDSHDLIRAVNVLRPRTIIPVHYSGWTHFKEDEAALKRTLAAHDDISFRTVFLRSGIPFEM
jgi:L-ascorbate metabolism protein UlaG (beta-lactamase superfamily)